MIRIAYPKNLFSISGRGLFSCFAAVIRNMEHAYNTDQKCFVLLDNSIDYYKAQEGHPNYTGNVWTQYYEQDELDPNAETITDFGHINIFNKRDIALQDIEPWRKIHDRYFRLLPKIQEEIDGYKIDDSVLAVHCRGLDKSLETKLKGLQEWEEAIRKEMAEGGFKRVLLCTDDLNYCQYFQARAHLYGLEMPRSFRSRETNAFDSSRYTVDVDPYTSGKGAIIDAYLMSKCKTIIRTQCSNLSAFSCLGKNVQKIVNM